MKRSGFSLTELLVAIAITAIVAFIGIPSFNSLMNSSAMLSASDDTLTAFHYARMEAVKRGNNVHVSQRDGSSWNGGVIVWVDANADGGFDSGEELRLWEPVSGDVTITSTNSLTSFEFYSSGEIDQSDFFTLCANRTGETGRFISILISGAIFADEVTCVQN